MNILIPMAGEGQRFSSVGYQCPKPLIEIEGETMIQYAIRTLGIPGRYIFIVRKYENEEFNRKHHNVLKMISSESIIIEIDYLTEGPACTCLLAEKYIDNDDSLVIANCDQIMDWNEQPDNQKPQDISEQFKPKKYLEVDNDGLNRKKNK